MEYDAPLQFIGSDGRGVVPGLRVHAGTVAALRELISRWKPDIVQAHGSEPLKYATLAVAGHRTSIVYRRIGETPDTISRGPRRFAHAFLIRRAAHVVAVTNALRTDTIEVFHIPAKKVVTIPNGVDARRVEPTTNRGAARRNLGIAPASPVVLSLGALAREKDPMAHLDVSRRVLAEEPTMVHLFVGRGPLRASIEKAVNDDPVLHRRTQFLGARSDVADILTASDVLLVASRTEGMPANVIEAGMAGLPVVAFAVGGIPEVVTHGSSGFLASPGDRRGLASRILELINNDSMRRVMAERARDRCRSLFDISTVAPSYLRVYQDLVDGG